MSSIKSLSFNVGLSNASLNSFSLSEIISLYFKLTISLIVLIISLGI